LDLTKCCIVKNVSSSAGGIYINNPATTCNHPHFFVNVLIAENKMLPPGGCGIASNGGAFYIGIADPSIAVNLMNVTMVNNGRILICRLLIWVFMKLKSV